GIHLSDKSFTSITVIAKILWRLISDGHPDFEADEPSWIPRAANVNSRPWAAPVATTAMSGRKIYSSDDAEIIVRQAVKDYLVLREQDCTQYCRRHPNWRTPKRLLLDDLGNKTTDAEFSLLQRISNGRERLYLPLTSNLRQPCR
ncbi:hypothetical protein E4U24_006108, partial [Claviceps purpurea]